MITITWKLDRLDGGEESVRRPSECLLEVDGKIRVDEEEAGWLNGFYLHGEDLESRAAFWELWDIDSRTCRIYETMMDPKTARLREPLPRLLVAAPGILFIEAIALLPNFRGKGLGREAMRETLRSCADDRIGAVLLNTDPLQYDLNEDGDWTRDDLPEPDLCGLPTDDQQRDQVKLQFHFRSWGMQLLPRTNYMVAAPETLSPEVADSWPPCVIKDLSNSCRLCGGLIDFGSDEWEETEEGPAHRGCV